MDCAFSLFNSQRYNDQQIGWFRITRRGKRRRTRVETAKWKDYGEDVVFEEPGSTQNINDTRLRYQQINVLVTIL